MTPLLLAPLLGSLLASAPSWVWVEGEAPARTNFPPVDQHAFVPGNAREAEVLSGGKWLGVHGEREQTLYAEYELEVPKDGRYRLYARKFWKHGPYRWRIGEGAWTAVGPEVALMDVATLRLHVEANWTYAGEVELMKGRHVLRVELTDNDGAAAFDAFLLTPLPFHPRGKLKPGESYGVSEPGWFAFEPKPDTFEATPLDLRALNEKRAGDGGFIVVKGEHFVHQDSGQPVRFWGVNTSNELLGFDEATLGNIARAWAKSGVNLVRLHGPVWSDDLRRVDPQHVERIHRFVEAMKAEGIYTQLSIYFPLWMRLNDQSPIKGYPSEGKHPFSLLFFDAGFQQHYLGWWRALLTTKSPRTGRSLVEEPAVAMIELVNEDSTLFWTFSPYDNVPAAQTHALEKQFGDWLARRYGSLQKAFTAWKQGKVRGDDLRAGRAGLLPLWDVFSHRTLRGQDTARFLTGLQRDFFVRSRDFIREELGYRAAITGSNWITADDRRLGPLDKWSNTALDFMDRHGYFDVGHTGERASWALSVGDRYEDRSALRFLPQKPGDPPHFSLPFFDIRYDGKPSAVSELNWAPPNALRADFPIVTAAYASLQGTNALMFFSTNGAGWDEQLEKFSIRTPVTFGQFPATAFLYRKGLVRTAPPVVEANLTVQRLFALEGAPASVPTSLDGLRKKDLPKAAATSQQNAFDPLAFLVGQVRFNFVDEDTPSRLADLSEHIDHGRKVVRSQTGELTWDYGKGLVTLDAPQAQGATGFLSKAGTLELGALRVHSGLEYGSVLAVALDEKPLASSSRILLQVMSQEKNHGWRVEGRGTKEIKSLGNAPLMVKALSGTVTLKREDASSLRVTALDFNGHPLRVLGRGPKLTLQPDVLYYLIEKPAK